MVPRLYLCPCPKEQKVLRAKCYGPRAIRQTTGGFNVRNSALGWEVFKRCASQLMSSHVNSYLCDQLPEKLSSVPVAFTWTPTKDQEVPGRVSSRGLELSRGWQEQVPQGRRLEGAPSQAACQRDPLTCSHSAQWPAHLFSLAREGDNL